jgi:hypothetical protein
MMFADGFTDAGKGCVSEEVTGNSVEKEQG